MKTKLALAIALLCVSTMALAADSDKPGPKWTYIEAGYMNFNPDASSPVGGASSDGWYGGASVKLAMFHIFGEYDDVGDYAFWNAGFGWHGLLGEPADLYFQAQWNDVSVANSSVSDNGYEVSGGVRWKILKWLEVKGQANWADYSTNSSEWSGDVGVLFSILNDRLGFGADYILGDKADTARGYVRWSFGK